MQTMGTLILLFAFSIGTATFIENDFGAVAAKAVVYNAAWFNFLLLLLTINLTGRIIKDKMYQPKKLTIFMFHFAFIVIIIGAAITRFISYEGVMHIREGDSSNSIISDITYVDIKAAGDSELVETDKSIMMSVLTQGAYSDKLKIDGKKFSFNSVGYIPNAREVITESDDIGDPYIILVLSDDQGRRNYSLKYGDNVYIAGKTVNFSENFVPEAINIKVSDGSLQIFSSDEIVTLSMTTSMTDTLKPETWHPLETRKLTTIGELRMVLTDFYPNGKIDYVPYTGKGSMMDALVIDVVSGNNSKEIVLRGGKGYQGEENTFEFEGVSFSMRYGAKEIVLPFSLTLVDFQLDRYPGSNSPSSYASEVIVTDNEVGDKFNYRIYMNNVLNYGGFRFYQSSYDKDELGTILSVGHDSVGTFFTYIGYFLMSLGMLLSIFNRNTRFALLGRLLKRNSNAAVKSVVILIALCISFGVQGQEFYKPVSSLPEISKEQASEFGKLVTQSQDGRFKPVNTLSGEILRKISRKSKLEGLTPDQVMLGMMTYPLDWQQVRMIKVSHPEVRELIGIDGKYASYLDFINMTEGSYKLGSYVSNAYEKKPGRRNKFDNEVIKVDERLNICYMVFKGDLLRIFPVPYEIDEPWLSPVSDLTGLSQEDSAFLTTIVPAYLDAVSTNNTGLAAQLLQGISDYQEKFSGSIMPLPEKVKYELMYNRMQIFENLSKVYGILGILLLILLFVEMFKPSKGLKYVVNFFISLVVIGFVLQTLGLILRWYISGHAPWSDGYESMIYIAWVTLLSGLLFASGSKMTIAATTFLSSVILMVAHLSWMDPEVTNLVPVLKSYWLTIHVSVITASYGFLALSSLLGLINLVLIITKNNRNAVKMNMKITELTAINERSVVIGLYLLTIGTFLGGIWANESWGRYWGWDPKETWALVSILVYSFIAHMRYMPGLGGKYAYNFATLISYGVILMTYFGVNYYLSGLHSYAKGDPVPVPNFVYYSIAIVGVIATWAYIRYRKSPEIKEEKVVG